MKTVTSFVLATITVTLLGAATSALAQEEESSALHTRTADVSFADLDVTDQNDARELLQRLERASRNACSQSVWVQHRDRFHTERKLCQETAYKSAVAGIDSRLGVDLEQVAGLSQSGDAVAVAE